jgi:hypothetical protein
VAWRSTGHRRTTWVTAQAVAAPFLVGFPVAAYYALVVRRRMAAVGPVTVDTHGAL